MQFDPFSADYFDQPHVAYEWLREHEPVHHNEKYGFYALTRYADVQAAFRAPEVFSSRHGVMLTNMADPEFDAHRDLPGLFSQYDPPLHESFRQAVNPLFRGERFEALAGEAQRLVDERLCALTDHAEFDLVQDFTQPVPAGVIFAALGLPPSDWDDLAAWAMTFMSALDVDETLADSGAAEAGQKVGGYLAQLAGTRRADPQPDMISALVSTSVRDGDGHRPLSTAEIAGIASLFVFAGWETTTRLIATTLRGRVHEDTAESRDHRADREGLGCTAPTGSPVW